MNVSLVFTVLNEAKSIRLLLNSIAAQTHMPSEVVVCDGGSHDDTVAQLRNETRFPVKVIVEPGANISRGRNISIAHAQHELIACTDAGVRLHPQWLAELIKEFHVDETKVVAGFFLPDPQTTFEVAMSATVLPEVNEINPATFLPSSRSILFAKSAWQNVGGYPEWLDYCEDLIFDLNLRRVYGAFAFAPRAIARFRPRGSLKSFFKQYYLYARGDGKAGLFFKRHLIRYATYLVALPALLVLGSQQPGHLVLLLIGFWMYHKTPFARLSRLAKDLPFVEKLKAYAGVPVIRITGDIAKMLGYPVGVIWKLRHRLG